MRMKGRDVNGDECRRGRLPEDEEVFMGRSIPGCADSFLDA